MPRRWAPPPSTLAWTLHDGALEAGSRHRRTIDGGRLPAGTYLLRAQGTNFSETQRVTIVR